MAPPNSVKVLEQCRVAPPPDSVIETYLPLTFFAIGYRYPPIEYLFFYEYPHSKTHFTDSLIPKLKHSLSLTLQHFYPLAGSLTWPPEFEKPVIRYVHSDSITLTIAESNNDFYHLSGNSAHDITESHPLVPHLPVSDTVAVVMALQFTLFPNGGFCIGMVTHHGVADGRSTTMFMKLWASICRSGDSSLLPDCLPIYERFLINDIAGLVKPNMSDNNESNYRSFVNMETRAPPDTVKVKGSFELSRGDIERVRKWVLTRCEKPLHATAFVITCAYVWVCLVRAEEIRNKKVGMAFPVDFRARLDPPLPRTYFGNCLTGRKVRAEACEIMGEDGVAIAVEAFSEVIRGLESGVLRDMEEEADSVTEPEWVIGITGSNQFGVYETDFGWGRPTKMEIPSVDKGRIISIAESRDGSGGVEVGLALNKLQMQVFASLLANGLKCF